MDAAYKSFSIAGFRPTTAPNPACCSSPNLLCPKCARLALNDLSGGYDPFSDPDISGHVPRSAGHLVGGAINNQQKETAMCMNSTREDDDVLPLPTINWAQEPEPTATDGCYHPGDLVVDPPALAQHELTNNATPDDDDVLPLPVVNWAAE